MDNPYAAHLRATDLDRTKVASLIDRAYAEGQLNSLEHDERVSAAMTAATRGDLLELIKDLQVERPEFAPPPQPKRASPFIPSQAPKVLLIMVIVLVVMMVIAVVAGIIAMVVFRGSSSGDAPAGATQTEVGTAVPPEFAGGDDEPADAGGDRGDSTPRISVYEMETTIRGDFLNDQGHIPDNITCPDALVAEPGESVECSVIDSGAEYPTTVTVIGVDLPNVTYNVTIRGVW
ncbi:DUF1707 domain-containing protein [Corynebacterium variabile]|uniref:DUF1707 domain-containing protein n=1 Tax=Corynebacterium variabile TaxID=1727 RepID=UPI003FD071D3